MDLFYNPTLDKYVTHGHLPHWTQADKLHFVTFRLADSLPQERVEQIRRERQSWEATHPEPYSEQDWKEFHRLFSERVDNWLDAGYGQCLFSEPQYSDILVSAFSYFDKKRYLLDHWVIMPNHVHVLIMPQKPYLIGEILHSWKSFSAKAINKVRKSGGQVWQREGFDHVVRNDPQLHKFRHYILENAARMGGKAVISKQNIISE